MSDNKMTPAQEKALFDDMKELKERSNQTSTTIALMEQQMTYLVNSFKEIGKLVTKSELDEFKEDTSDKVEKLRLRLKVLEEDKIKRETIEMLTTKRQKWWSDNWHKVFMVVVVCVPSFVAIYNLINVPVKGGQDELKNVGYRCGHRWRSSRVRISL